MAALGEVAKLCEAATAIVDEENRRLGAGETANAFPELVESKVRLSLQLGAAIEAARQAPEADAADQEMLSERLDGLRAAITENSRLLKARIGVTEDLIATVLATARAQSAATTRGYISDGRAVESHRPAAIAIDRAV